MWLCKSISHIQVCLTNIFPTQPIKLKQELQICGRVLIATHLDHWNYLANQTQGVVSKYDLSVFITLLQGSSKLRKEVHFFWVPPVFQWIPWIWLDEPHLRFPVQDPRVGGDAQWPLYGRGHWIPRFQSHRLLLINRVYDSNLQGLEESNGSSSNDACTRFKSYCITPHNWTLQLCSCTRNSPVLNRVLKLEPHGGSSWMRAWLRGSPRLGPRIQEESEWGSFPHCKQGSQI